MTQADWEKHKDTKSKRTKGQEGEAIECIAISRREVA